MIFNWLCFTSFGSCVVQFGCYTVTNLDTEDGLMPLCLKLHYKTQQKKQL